jgi:preprotein translocase subunit SecG
MDTISRAVLIVHTLIALGIVALVLLQRGKGADAGAGFGSGASGTVFGARGSTSFFSRATAVLATAFFISSLTLAYLSSRQAEAPDSIVENAPVTEEPAESPASDTGSEMPAADLPSVESADDTPDPAAGDDLPSLDEEPPAVPDEQQ